MSVSSTKELSDISSCQRKRVKLGQLQGTDETEKFYIKIQE